MVLQHNLPSMNARRYFNNNTSKLNKSLEKLSSGYAINRAGDNAAGLAVSEKMRSMICGMKQSVKNSMDGISLIQTFEGALSETVAIIHRMKTLADQAANGTYDNDVDRVAIHLEYTQLCDEIDQIADTDFNGVIMLNGGIMSDGHIANGVDIQNSSGSTNTNGGLLIGTNLLLNTTNDIHYSAEVRCGGVFTVIGRTPLEIEDIGNGMLNDEDKMAIVANYFTISLTHASVPTSPFEGDDSWNHSSWDLNMKALELLINAECELTWISAPPDEYYGNAYIFPTFSINGTEVTTTENADGWSMYLGEGSTNEFAFNLQYKGEDVISLAYYELSNWRFENFGDGIKVKFKLFISNDNSYDVSRSNSFNHASANLTYTDHLILQVGARTKDAVIFTFSYSSNGIGDLKSDLNCTASGLGLDNLTLSTQESANYAIDRIDYALNKVTMVRATFGAVQNRLEHKIDNLNNSTENLTTAESQIRDTDMAAEMMNFTKQQILSQASQSMLAQANSMSQQVLNLLNG